VLLLTGCAPGLVVGRHVKYPAGLPAAAAWHPLLVAVPTELLLLLGLVQHAGMQRPAPLLVVLLN
jgi:hypothetical protein